VEEQRKCGWKSSENASAGGIAAEKRCEGAGIAGERAAELRRESGGMEVEERRFSAALIHTIDPGLKWGA